MPDIRTRADTPDVQFGANFEKHSISQSDAGRELVVSITKSGGVNDADLLAVYRQLTQSGGDGTGNPETGTDAGTFAAIGTADGEDFVSGTTTPVFVRLQTTGAPDLTTVAGTTLAVVATFQPRA